MAETATLAAPTVADRVAAGAAWLDQRQPDWWANIDLSRLELAHSCQCVLGQLYGDYRTAPIAIDQAVALGFDGRRDIPDGDPELWREFDALQEEWTRVIEERRLEAGRAREVAGDGA